MLRQIILLKYKHKDIPLNTIVKIVSFIQIVLQTGLLPTGKTLFVLFKQGKLRSLAFQINHSLRWKRFFKDTIQRRSSTERNIPWA